MKTLPVAIITVATVGLSLFTACNLLPGGGSGDAAGWVDLFDGKTMDGWKKAAENENSWRLEDGLLVSNGNRCHLFYVGDPEPFVDFELEVVVMTRPNSNSGVYFHTQYQEKGWPKYGFEMQVNNTFKDPQKTAGLYGVFKVLDAPAKDNEWFTILLRVEGKRVTVDVDGKQIVDYTEPADAKAGQGFTRVLDKGTFALQAHDPGSTVLYKSIRARRL